MFEASDDYDFTPTARRGDKAPGPGAYLCSCHFADGKKENGPHIFAYNEKKLFNFPSPERNRRQSRKRKIDDSTVASSSNLASLFGASMTVPDASLTYTAPKQPKPIKDNVKETVPKAKQQSIVVSAKVISLYKLTKDLMYDALGKHGLALIKAETQSNQELLIYKEKTNIITRSKITNTFQLVIQNDCFSSFTDDSNQAWLLKFESLEDRDAVCTELKKLGGNIVDNTSTGTTDDESTTSAKEAESPEGKSTSYVDRVQDSSKLSNEENLIEEEQNSDSSQNRVKADILSRMAKMGQLVMSNDRSSQPIDISDSDTTDGKQIVNKPQRKPRKLLPHRDKEMQQSNDVIADKPQPADRCLNTVTSMTVVSHNLQPESLPVAPNLMALLQPNALEKILIDNRTHDTEVKLNLCEISTKLDYLIKNSQSVNHSPNPPSYSSPSSSDDATHKSKLKALQLRSENLNAELQNLQIKYSQLQNINQALEQRLKATNCNETAIQSQELKISELEREVEKLKTELESTNLLKNEIDDYQHKIDDLTKELIDEKMKNAVETFAKVKTDESVKDKISDIVKQRMNSMYEQIMTRLGDASDEVRSVISQNVRRTAFKILKDFEQI